MIEQIFLKLKERFLLTDELSFNSLYLSKFTKATVIESARINICFLINVHFKLIIFDDIYLFQFHLQYMF